LARKLAKESGLQAEFRSAGVFALDGAEISQHSAQILRERGITDEIVSRPLTKERVDWADLILTMTNAHKRVVIQRHPEAVEKTFTLKEYVEDDEQVIAQRAESERLIVELELKKAAGQPISKEEEERLSQLQQLLPAHEISDPFGRDLETYRRCADEIEACLNKLVRKLSG